jgi:Protein of unknown function (DUF2971)
MDDLPPHPQSHPDVNDCLFHYTSAGGLRGILESRCVWATDAAFLNDASEITYAGRQLELHLDNLVKALTMENPEHGSVERYRLAVMGSALDALVKFNDPGEYAPSSSYVSDGATYVSCFTERPDQLSQWRGYGGRGYSIGFSRDGLNELSIQGEEGRNAEVGDISAVRYGPRAIEALCAEVTDHFRSRPPSAHPGTSGFFETVNYLMPLLARIKDNAFEEEREWRVAVSRYNQQPTDYVHFRDDNRLVPYVRLGFDPASIAWVYIGPGADFRDQRALRAFLRKNGYDLDRVWVEPSRAPYRGG